MIYDNSFESIKELITTLQKLDLRFYQTLMIFFKSHDKVYVLLTIIANSTSFSWVCNFTFMWSISLNNFKTLNVVLLKELNIIHFILTKGR